MKLRKLAVLFLVILISVSYLSIAAAQSASSAAPPRPVVEKNPFPYFVDTTAINHAPNSSTLTTQSSVYPSRLYSSEPAPMGIADYGLGPGGVPYEYTSTSFEGIIHIANLSTYNSSLTSSYYGYHYGLSFQLNTVLSFTYDHVTYVYWTQDVAFLNTSNHSLYIIDNVWNFTSSSSKIHDSTISNGSGQVNTTEGFYFDIGGSPGGSEASPTYPATLELRINATSSSGVPGVSFQYNAGSGWITFDSPIFTFAKGATKPYFVVNGNSYTPIGNFYDSELILGGPAGGSNTSANVSNVDLSLLYWNNHNYQSVENAYNYGSDTAEGISNVTVSESSSNNNGSIYANVGTGNGGLQMLYSRSNVAILNVSVPLATSGTLFVNGTPHYFTGSDVNVTLMPGTYSITVESTTGNYNLGDLSLTAGEYSSLSTENVYSVTFTESILPPGTQWFVNISGVGSYSSYSSSILVVLPNGTYDYTVSTTDKDYFNHTDSSIKIEGSNQSINVVFRPYLYDVTFIESGLLLSTSWAVFFDNSDLNASQSDQIGFRTTNGTHDFAIQIVIGYASNVTTGTVTIDGSSSIRMISFSPAKDYNVTFIEKGLKSGMKWYLNLTNGQSENSTSTSITYEMPNGTYSYYDSAGIEYSTSYGQVQVAGKDINETLNFIELGLLKINVVQNQTRLSLNGNNLGLIGLEFSKYILPGNYTLSDALSGYQPFTDYFTIVSGKNISISIDLKLIPYYGFFTGTISPGNATIEANGYLIPVVNGSFNAILQPGTYYVTVFEKGYRSVEFSVSIALLQTSVHNVLLTPSSSVEVYGFVNPSHASVVVQNMTAYVSSSGYYFLWVQPGIYNISVYSPGYIPCSKQVNIMAEYEENFTLKAEPGVSSEENSSGITAIGFGLKVGNLGKSNGIISVTYDGISGNGSLIITVPYSSLEGVNISELLHSRVYIGSQPYSNFSVLVSSNHTIILYVWGLDGDPQLSWLYSPGASLNDRNQVLDYAAVAVLLIAIVGIGIILRRKK